jgi:hypothetical protein
MDIPLQAQIPCTTCSVTLKDAVWNLMNEQTEEHITYAFLRVSNDGKFCSSFQKLY